ncbi:hypothetical protein [Nonlabens xiamenensis]|uniref:hypothetical protein n=1 Tax=Nonlabens xiamenensis TaxID=2341043 RepID=UPI000F60538E|nr:hypothetical protein [Nonlabens xiamenensis]
MKKLLALILLGITLLACQSDDDAASSNEGIEGMWELTAIYVDPGNGSGNFEPASGKTLQFTSQNLVNCNQGFCFGSITQATTTGTYNTAATSIEINNCQANYTLDGDVLELSYFCIEPCVERYNRVN